MLTDLAFEFLEHASHRACQALCNREDFEIFGDLFGPQVAGFRLDYGPGYVGDGCFVGRVPDVPHTQYRRCTDGTVVISQETDRQILSARVAQRPGIEERLANRLGRMFSTDCVEAR